ncbi:hypothetical protein L208DRAFT_101824 [Tricholoma matsutake]|nr:hypothetical protein L208DRAFT_101824 [Tricholoma matsutake 945]
MTDEIPTYLKFSRSPAVKGYLQRSNSDQTRTQKLKEWAGQKIKKRRRTDVGDTSVTERLTLFPGWATRRYSDVSNDEFGICVFVSGFASKPRLPEQTTRPQRVFIRLAKSFASLQKLTADVIAPDPDSEAPTRPQATTLTETLASDIKLSPQLTEIPEEYAIEALERVFQRASATDDIIQDTSCASVDDCAEERRDASENENVTPNKHSPQSHTQAAADVLRRQHTNLERRLLHFWAPVLPARTVRLQLFASPPFPLSPEEHHHPLDSQDVITAADGGFQVLFQIPWADLLQHPAARHITFGERSKEHELLVNAQLLPSSASPSISTVSSPTFLPSSASPSTSATSSSPTFPPSVDAQSPSIHSQRDQVPPNVSPMSSSIPSMMQITLSHTPIRVISDIDDTVKLSDILLGARMVFRNFFIKDLQENVIPAMSEWYAGMWNRGVRFHYVSNSPFQILPVINEFLQISKLPPGSIKLKSYAGGSGVLSAQGARKRRGVVDILDAFPESHFFLIGDSGQQDLELYADLAYERPHQIFAVLIRYADNVSDPIDDTTGEKEIGAAGTRSRPLLSSGGGNMDGRPGLTRTLSDMLGWGSSSPSTKSPILTTPLNVSPDMATKESTNGSTNYFTPTRLTTEPDSTTLPSPPLRASPFNPSQAFKTSPKTSPRSQTQSQTVVASARISPKPHSRGYTARSSSSPSSTSPVTSRSLSSPTFMMSLAGMSDADRKRDALQKRVYKARRRMPKDVPLRVFRDPSECVEIKEMLRRVGL